MKSLIIGYGSIGRRHKEVLQGMGIETALVSSHAENAHRTLEAGLESFQPDYVVIANRTSEHLETLDRLDAAGFRGRCLVEKPLVGENSQAISGYSYAVVVGYVLRFHPLIHYATEQLKGRRIHSIHAYAGQHLPNWRPDTDYRECYSSQKEQGGGVLRDLSHELDYLRVLAGQWTRVAALGGHFSQLEINSDDVFTLLFETERCPAISCQLNYLDRNTRRDCTIQYDDGTLYLDFIENRLVHNGMEKEYSVERNAPFEAMHQSVLRRDSQIVCSLEEGIDTVELIEAAERAAKDNSWVCRNDQ